MKKISLGAIAGVALLATSTGASAGGYEHGYGHGYGHGGGGHRGHYGGNNASFYIGFGSHGGMSYGFNVSRPVYVRPQPRVVYYQPRPQRVWRPVVHQQYGYSRPQRIYQQSAWNRRGYCPQNNRW